MSSIFPNQILHLPKADIPIKGLDAYLSQSSSHQILFMEFKEDIQVPEHNHESQWGIVLEGEIELIIDGVKKVYTKGDRYYIPAGVNHSARIYAGYSDITFFNQKDRYKSI